MSDGAVIPGNLHLSEAEKTVRVERWFRPYHVLPLWGTYSGPSGAFLGMDVTVKVTETAG